MSDIEPHIPLAQRKVLAARLVQIEASLPLEKNFRKKKAGATYKYLDNEIPKYWEEEGEEAEIRGNSMPLDASVNSLLSHLNSIAEVRLGKRHPDLLTDLQSAIQKRAGDISCERCSPRAPHICDGGDYDDEITSHGGLCIAPLKGMFDLALEVSLAYYSHYGTLLDGTNQPHIVFSTEHTQGKPHDLPVNYYINGAVYYDDSAALNKSRVVIIIPPEKFDRATYLSALYIPFHECVAHAFYAITPKTEGRKEPDADDRFAEGWMDLVAYMVLEETIDRVGLAASIEVNDQLLNRKTRDAVEYFHLARVLEHDDNNKSEHAYQRGIGKSAASKLYSLLKNLSQHCPQPREKFLQISFDLNMMSDFVEDSESFVTVMDFLEEDKTRHKKIEDIVIKYLKTDDIHEFIQSIVGLL